MLPNLSYPIPTIGRITFGDAVQNERGKRIPLALNHFTITAQHKQNGQWAVHPIQKEVAKKMGVDDQKITEIPVKVMFNEPSLTIRERLECYQDGRLACASCSGGQARRATSSGIQTVTCSGPESCEYAKNASHGCDLMARINLKIDADAEGFRSDDFSTFILRTRGYNSDRTVLQKLQMISSLYNGRLVGLPFLLKLRKKSTPVSFNSPFYYVDLVLNCSIMDGVAIVKRTAAEMEEAGLNQAAFEEAVRKGLANGPFEDTVEEMMEMESVLIGQAPLPEAEAGDWTESSLATDVVVLEASEQSTESSRTDKPAFGLDALRDYFDSLPNEKLAA